MGLQIFTGGAGGSRFACDDDGGFGDLVAKISVRANAPVTSCARERVAESFLKQLGLHSRVEPLRRRGGSTSEGGRPADERGRTILDR